MKRFININILLVALLCFSCQNNEDFEAETDLLNLNNTESPTTVTAKNGPDDEFETDLHWVSFLIAKAVNDNPAAEQFLMDRLDEAGSSATIPVSFLFEENRYGENEFRDAFRDAFFHYYYDQSSCPDDGTRSPKGAPKPPRSDMGPCMGVGCDHAVYQRYVTYITVDHCLEVHFPIGYVSGRPQMYTTAHPLNNDTMNEGYVYPENCSNYLVVGPNNMRALDNLIVTRPYRNPLGGCPYDTYSVFDFTLFLD